MRKYLTLFFWIFIMTGAGTLQAQGQNPFNVDYDASALHLKEGETKKIEVNIVIPPEHYLYADKVILTWEKVPGLKINLLPLAQPVLHPDPFSGKNKEVYFNGVTVISEVSAEQDFNSVLNPILSGRLKYQGCSSEICFLAQYAEIKIPLGDTSEVSTSVEIKKDFWNLLANVSPDHLLKLPLGWLYLFAFMGGLITCFTPCVFPIIPLTMSFIGAAHHEAHRQGREAMLALGMVMMYCILGLIATWLGLGAGFLFKSKFFILFLAFLFFIFALGMFEVLPFELPATWQKKLSALGGNSLWGAWVVGLLLGFIASPCVGPLVGPFLLLAAQKQSQWFGASLLASYGLGMGLFFLLLAHSYKRMRQKLGPQFFKRLKNLLAVLLLLPACYYAWVFYKTQVSQFKPAAYWQTDYATAKDLAQQKQQLIFVDFYADWCPPCVEMEHTTFIDPKFIAQAQNWVMLKVDCTTYNPTCASLSEKFHIVGMPTMLILNAQGEIMAGTNQITAYKTVDQVLAIMQNALKPK